jgi:hypothetical protein
MLPLIIDSLITLHLYPRLGKQDYEIIDELILEAVLGNLLMFSIPHV